MTGSWRTPIRGDANRQVADGTPLELEMNDETAVFALAEDADWPNVARYRLATLEQMP